MMSVGVIFERQADGTWLGLCPSVPGAFAQAGTLPACRRRLREAIESVLLYAPPDDIEDLAEARPVKVVADILEVEIPERPARDLVSQAEIARMAGVTRQAVHSWVKARRDFPRSVTRGSSGALWERDDVLRWLRSGRRVAGRPSAREKWRGEPPPFDPDPKLVTYLEGDPKHEAERRFRAATEKRAASRRG